MPFKIYSGVDIGLSFFYADPLTLDGAFVTLAASNKAVEASVASQF